MRSSAGPSGGTESSASWRRPRATRRGVGAVYSHRWRSVLPYTVRFEITTTRVQEPLVPEGTARGELKGSGAGRLGSTARLP